MKAAKPGPALVPSPVTELTPSKYKTVEEAAAYVKATPWTIGQAIRAGQLRAKKNGKKFVTTVEWIDEWFEQLEDAA